jgi:hypothetical protein
MRPTDPTFRFRVEFRHREKRFLARKARRAAIVAHLPWWLHWVHPLVLQLRFTSPVVCHCSPELMVLSPGGPCQDERKAQRRP